MSSSEARSPTLLGLAIVLDGHQRVWGVFLNERYCLSCALGSPDDGDSVGEQRVRHPLQGEAMVVCHNNAEGIHASEYDPFLLL